jgi:PadR family transcriptional regulator PadR
VSENNRRAKYYALTAKGRRQLSRDVETWAQFAAALGRIVDAG